MNSPPLALALTYIVMVAGRKIMPPHLYLQANATIHAVSPNTDINSLKMAQRVTEMWSHTATSITATVRAITKNTTARTRINLENLIVSLSTILHAERKCWLNSITMCRLLWANLFQFTPTPTSSNTTSRYPYIRFRWIRLIWWKHQLIQLWKPSPHKVPSEDRKVQYPEAINYVILLFGGGLVLCKMIWMQERSRIATSSSSTPLISSIRWVELVVTFATSTVPKRRRMRVVESSHAFGIASPSAKRVTWS